MLALYNWKGVTKDRSQMVTIPSGWFKINIDVAMQSEGFINVGIVIRNEPSVVVAA